MKKFALVTLAVTMLTAVVSAQTEMIRVAVVTSAPADGFTDPDFSRRTDSVKDLKNKFTDKKKVFTVVDDVATADIVVEVLGRGLVDSGKTMTDYVRTPTGPVATTSKLANIDLAITLKAGTYESEIHSDYAHSVFWRQHAGIVADKVEKWVAANRVRLLELRTSPK